MDKTTRHIDTTSSVAWKGEVSDAVFTVPNLVSFVRLCLIPVFFSLLLAGNDLAATVVFGVAASTDWVDGLIARRTNSVSKLGRILDPAVDRLLMIFAVIGLLLSGRLPLWIVALVLARDVVMLFGYFFLLRKYRVRVDVILAGKVATALLFVGAFGLMANWPLVPGLGICDFDWLPGFSFDSVSWGIWPVYAGLVLGVFTTAYYACTGLLASHEAALEAEGIQ